MWRSSGPSGCTGLADADAAIRDAATVILVRNAATNPSVLMGQRGAKAAFMPSKFVFPGGAIDAGDAALDLDLGITALTRTRLKDENLGPIPEAVAAAAIRELWEETGLILGRAGNWPDAPEDWRTFADTGHIPDANALTFVFRAITPPGRPRRFDARFLLADASALASDPDDFSRASDELSSLTWVPVAEARSYALPFITEVVLAEISARLPDLSAPDIVPFFKNDDEESLFQSLGRV